jgi:hypothetical protein
MHYKSYFLFQNYHRSTGQRINSVPALDFCAGESDRTSHINNITALQHVLELHNTE